MTKLEERDRRRSKALMLAWNRCKDTLPNLIAAALKREREDAGFAAVNYLFARKAERAKATAAILGTEKVKR